MKGICENKISIVTKMNKGINCVNERDTDAKNTVVVGVSKAASSFAAVLLFGFKTQFKVFHFTLAIQKESFRNGIL